MSTQINALKGLVLLKNSTRELHARLDRASGMTRLMASDLSLQDYSDILKKLYRLYAALEPVLLEAELRLGSHISWQTKSGWLKNDLQKLQAQHVNQHHEVFGEPGISIKTINSSAQVAGCLYVLEGATLGGQMIAKRLRTTLGDEVKGALTFFDAYGSCTQEKWGGNCQLINAELTDDHKSLVACAYAQHVFELFIAVMCHADDSVRSQSLSDATL